MPLILLEGVVARDLSRIFFLCFLYNSHPSIKKKINHLDCLNLQATLIIPFTLCGGSEEEERP